MTTATATNNDGNKTTTSMATMAGRGEGTTAVISQPPTKTTNTTVSPHTYIAQHISHREALRAVSGCRRGAQTRAAQIPRSPSFLLRPRTLVQRPHAAQISRDWGRGTREPGLNRGSAIGVSRESSRAHNSTPRKAADRDSVEFPTLPCRLAAYISIQAPSIHVGKPPIDSVSKVSHPTCALGGFRVEGVRGAREKAPLHHHQGSRGVSKPLPPAKRCPPPFCKLPGNRRYRSLDANHRWCRGGSLVN